MGDSGAGQGQPRDNQRGESLAFLAATAFLTAPPSPRPCLFTGRPGASSHLRAPGDAVPEGRTLSRGPSYSRRFGHFPKPASRFRLCRLLRTVYKCHLCFILILDSLSLSIIVLHIIPIAKTKFLPQILDWLRFAHYYSF